MTATRPLEFDARLLSYMPGLRRLAFRLDPKEPDDLLNDTVTWSLDKWTSFRPEGGFYNWLRFGMRSIVSNRRRKRVLKTTVLDAADRIGTAPQQETITDVRGVVARLSGREGEILLRRAMGDELKEIGAGLGLDRSRIGQLEQAARTRLLADLEPRRVAA